MHEAEDGAEDARASARSRRASRRASRSCAWRPTMPSISDRRIASTTIESVPSTIELDALARELVVDLLELRLEREQALAARLLGEADHLPAPRPCRSTDVPPVIARIASFGTRFASSMLDEASSRAARAADHDHERRDVDEGGRVAALHDHREEQHDEGAADSDCSRLLHLAPLLRIMHAALHGLVVRAAVDARGHVIGRSRTDFNCAGPRRGRPAARRMRDDARAPLAHELEDLLGRPRRRRAASPFVSEITVSGVGSIVWIRSGLSQSGLSGWVSR